MICISLLVNSDLTLVNSSCIVLFLDSNSLIVLVSSSIFVSNSLFLRVTSSNWITNVLLLLLNSSEEEFCISIVVALSFKRSSKLLAFLLINSNSDFIFANSLSNKSILLSLSAIISSFWINTALCSVWTFSNCSFNSLSLPAEVSRNVSNSACILDTICSLSPLKLSRRSRILSCNFSISASFVFVNSSKDNLLNSWNIWLYFLFSFNFLIWSFFSLISIILEIKLSMYSFSISKWYWFIAILLIFWEVFIKSIIIIFLKLFILFVIFSFILFLSFVILFILSFNSLFFSYNISKLFSWIFFSLFILLYSSSILCFCCQYSFFIFTILSLLSIFFLSILVTYLELLCKVWQLLSCPHTSQSFPKTGNIVHLFKKPPTQPHFSWQFLLQEEQNVWFPPSSSSIV